MIVCLCKAVSDRTIRAAREAGAETVEAIGAATGAGTGCGCCRGAIATILAEPCRLVTLAPRPGPDRAAGAPRGGADRAGASESIPARVAAEGLKTP